MPPSDTTLDRSTRVIALPTRPVLTLRILPLRSLRVWLATGSVRLLRHLTNGAGLWTYTINEATARCKALNVRRHAD